MINKTLVLVDELFYQYGFDEKEKKNVLFLPLMKFRHVCKFLRIVRKIHLSSLLPFKKVWFYRWVEVVSQYDTVVLGETGNSVNVVNYINKHFPNKRIIVWFRNPLLYSAVKPANFDRQKCELWSFDEQNAKEYELRFNPQFYMRNPKYVEYTAEWDAFFIGNDKGRLARLLDMEKLLQEKGFTTNFRIVGYNSKNMLYDNILNAISKCKIIVDFQCDWQSGLTLRPLESIFYKKKLITNNPNIKKMDFYNPNNIFIWGEDAVENLPEFLKNRYVDVPEHIVCKYDLYSWVRRFYEN